jgi:hypothetical protein
MIAWFQTFVRRHLIADDPWPHYSDLDRMDHLDETPMTTAEALAGIEARLKGDQKEPLTGVSALSVRDRTYLLALVKKQAAKLEAVADLVEQAEKNGRNTVYANEVSAAIAERAAA